MTDSRASSDELRMPAADVPEPTSLDGFGRAREHPVVRPEIAEAFACHFKYVWRCLRALGVRDATLDDAVQDVFLVVQKKLVHFDGNVQLRTWLYAIALRVARRYRTAAVEEARRQSDASALSTEDFENARDRPVAMDAEHAVEHRERLDLARRALERLDEAKREVFVLGHVEQMSAPEIAEAIGIPLNTVYSRLRAARVEFSAHIARLEPRRPR
jgi:RNA polymerase sigma-70 factor, ECF subfamily